MLVNENLDRALTALRFDVTRAIQALSDNVRLSDEQRHLSHRHLSQDEVKAIAILVNIYNASYQVGAPK